MVAVERQSVLSKINSVLVVAGLNDTVWSIRDCDSTLFVLVYKKLFGKVGPHHCFHAHGQTQVTGICMNAAPGNHCLPIYE